MKTLNFCHMCTVPVLSITLLIHTARHKVAACVFTTFGNQYLTGRVGNLVTNCCVYILYSYCVDRACYASLIQFFFNRICVKRK